MALLFERFESYEVCQDSQQYYCVTVKDLGKYIAGRHGQFLLLVLLQVAQRLSEPGYFGALCLLVDEAGFLVESKTQALIAQLPASAGQMVAAEAIVRSLGVTDGPAFDALIDALSADGGAAAADRAASLTGGSQLSSMVRGCGGWTLGGAGCCYYAGFTGGMHTC